MKWHRQFASAVFVVLALWAPTGFALGTLRVGASSVENYTGCGCNLLGDLYYTNDQATMFLNRMDDVHTRVFLYQDSLAWNSDFVEDQLGGTDNWGADDVHFMWMSGHGVLVSSSLWEGHLCKSSSYTACTYNTSKTYLGEVSGQSYSTTPGMLRFLALSTCDSVDRTNAANVWQPVFRRGRNLMYVMGYHGLSADSENTDEVGHDFADKTLGSAWTLKQEWFWAIEDWMINDTGALISAGDTEAEAISNRDNIRLTSDPNVTTPAVMAWSWHEG